MYIILLIKQKEKQLKFIYFNLIKKYVYTLGDDR